jgi:cytoplasmic iron level regulating protein YaaA (DUF328/UPF0246 family)
VIILLSPAKTLDFESTIPKLDYTVPVFQEDAFALVKTIVPIGQKGLKELMKVSEKLSVLNCQRFVKFKNKPDYKCSRAAVFSFNGDVYDGLNIKSFSIEEIYYAQSNLRILSGLYGLLKPLDLIQPYRLEMGTKLKNAKGKNLYAWWGNRLANELNKDLKSHITPVIINLASEEYFRSVKKNLINNYVSPVFQDYVSGKFKTVGFYAKKARGLMAAYILKNKIEKVESLKDFNLEGYKFDFLESSENELIFRRKK